MFRTPQPQAAISISGDGIAAVGLTRTTGRPSISVKEVVPLERGVVMPSMTSSNIIDRKSVAVVLNQILTKYKTRPTRVAMVLPDAVAKVTLLTFDTVPERGEDLAQLIRLKVQKSTPFNLDEAQLSYIDCGKNIDKQMQFLAVLVQKSVLNEYENICNDAGLHVGRVDLTSLNLINANLYTNRNQQIGDWMLVHVAQHYNTVTVVRSKQIIFYRSQTADPDHSLEDFIHQTTMYYEDRLAGNGISHVVFAVSSIENIAEPIESVFEQAFKGSPNVIFEQVGEKLSTAIHNVRQVPISKLDSLAAPIGILLRDRHD